MLSVLAIQKSFHGFPSRKSKLIKAYETGTKELHSFQIGGVSVVLPFGRLYALFNAKWLYIAFCILFLAGSALCGGAPTMDAFIVGRVIAGLGGIGMYLGVMTLLSVNTTPTERPMYLGLV